MGLPRQISPAIFITALSFFLSFCTIIYDGSWIFYLNMTSLKIRHSSYFGSKKTENPATETEKNIRDGIGGFKRVRSQTKDCRVTGRRSRETDTKTRHKPRELRSPRHSIHMCDCVLYHLAAALAQSVHTDCSQTHTHLRTNTGVHIYAHTYKQTNWLTFRWSHSSKLLRH